MRRAILILILLYAISPPGIVLGVGLPAGTAIQLVAGADYSDALNDSHSAPTTSVTLTVIQVAGVAIESQPGATQSTPGQSYYIPLRIINTGNATDIANVGVVSSRGWTSSVIYDDNADGVHQSSEQWTINNTGMMVADGYCPCFVRVNVPTDAATGDTVTVTATSRFSSAQGQSTSNLGVPAPGSIATSLTARANPASPYVGQAVTVTGLFAPASVRSLTVTVTSPLGSPSTSTVNTAADGSYSHTFTPNSAGTWNVGVAFARSGVYEPCSAGVNVQVNDKTPTSIGLSSSDDNLVSGETVTIMGTFAPARQVAVDFSYTAPGGSAVASRLTTDTSGRFTWTRRLDTAGDWLITASYSGSDTLAPSTRELTLHVAAPLPEHRVSISAGPTLTPASVDSGMTTQCSISASCARAHAVNYAWSDGGAGGSFTPSATAQNPVYNAPLNSSASNRLVTLSCAVTCSDDVNVSSSGSATLTVRPKTPPQVVSVSPEADETCVASDAIVTVVFDKAMDHAATESALVFSPAFDSPTFTWSADSKSVEIAQSGLFSGTDYVCSVLTGARSAEGVNLAVAYSWDFSTVSMAGFEHSRITAEGSAVFQTPRILLNDPSRPNSVTLFITLPRLVGIDTSTSGGNLVCVEKGADVGTFFTEWDSQTREIGVTAQITNPGAVVEVVKSITLTAPAGGGTHTLTLNGCPGLDVEVTGAAPGDFNGDASISISDASAFIMQWTRWHQNPLPSFDPAADGAFDLAPRTTGAWPNWTPIGDGAITIQDASAFIECWTVSHTPQPQGAADLARTAKVRIPVVDIRRDGNMLILTTNDVTNGLFEAAVRVPTWCGFDPSLDRDGNLANVTRGGDIGAFFFSEFDPYTRTVRITGDVRGKAPYNVAVIRISDL